MSDSQPETLIAAGRLTHGGKIVLLSLGGGLAGMVIALFFVWTSDLARGAALAVTVLLVGSWIGCAWAVRARVVRPLQTISNLLLALREEDFSIRANILNRDDALGEVLHEVNALSDTLRDQRLGALEASALLRAVMEEISVAVFAFDQEQRLKLANRAGEQLLGSAAERMLERTAADLGLAQCLEGPPVRTLEGAFAGGMGRWALRRSTFRQRGQTHQLVVLADLSQALREEERQAWQRLLRVLGHELNNSLAPIRSISGSLGQMMAREPLPSDWRQDMKEGLAVISARAEALSRFMGDYSRLARLPQPKLQPVAVGPLLNRVLGLEHRLRVALTAGPEAIVSGDPDQLEQLLINLVRNAVDASSETKGGGTSRGARRRRGSRPIQHRESLRAVLHDEAQRFRHRPGPEPADRRSPRWQPDAREPERPRRLCRAPAPAAGGGASLNRPLIPFPGSSQFSVEWGEQRPLPPAHPSVASP